MNISPTIEDLKGIASKDNISCITINVFKSLVDGKMKCNASIGFKVGNAMATQLFEAQENEKIIIAQINNFINQL